MGLDASVYCNCFEMGRLTNPPPADFDVYISEEGGLERHNPDLETQIAFDVWRYEKACEHQDTILIHHRLGNISLVALLREELKKHPDTFPVILTKVIYNGIHGGDWLTLDDIQKIQKELPFLNNFHCSDSKSQMYMEGFYSQMVELVGCALAVGKPIVF